MKKYNNKYYMSKILNLLDKEQYEQRTDKWYEIRKNILTASCIASILDANPYHSKLKLLYEKCDPSFNELNNDATNWGIKYEPIAISFYQNLKNEIVYNVGLYIHDTYKWLGASPDGLRNTGKLLEIKCVFRRRITDDVPLYYWMQVQIQLEVCDLEECDLFQCKFVEYNSYDEFINDVSYIDKGIIENEKNGEKIYWKLEKYSLNTIHRDKKWFKSVCPILNNFWDEINYYKKNGIDKINIKKYDDVINSNSNLKKRKRNERNERKNDNKINNNIEIIDKNKNKNKKNMKTTHYINENWNEWVDGKQLKNYINNDPLLDWLELYEVNQHNVFHNDKNDFNDYLIEEENKFYANVIKNTYDKIGNENIISIGHCNEKFSINKYNQTVNAIHNNVPVILNGILHNRSNLTYGLPDIIIRGDVIHKIFNNNGNGNGNDYDETAIINDRYYIICIRYLSLELKENNVVINKGNINSIKAELKIYNDALKNIVDYDIPFSIIIGRKYKKTTGNVYGTFETYGLIQSNDNEKINEKISNAIEWIKDVKRNGSKWNINHPHRWELYPNMSNMNDYPWHDIKKKIAIQLEEITMMWNCGIRERQLCHQNNIFTWKNIDCDILGFNEKNKQIIQNIIYANTFNTNILNFNRSNISKNDKLYTEFFIDFESVNNIGDNNETIIYMIGVGWEANSQWNYEKFVVDKLSHHDEHFIIQKWFQFMTNINNQRESGRGHHKNKIIKLYHWSKAEVSEFNKAVARHNIIIDFNFVWFDLLDFFKNNYIAINGAFNYGLKTIIKALNNNGIIDTKWDNNTIDGTIAMLVAIKCNEKINSSNNMSLLSFPEMNDIVKYNEIDCKVLWSILLWLRKL